jgi:hypothetical protein
MIQVGLLTEEQANWLKLMQYIEGVYFNPIQDIDGNWIISQEEINGCSIDWAKQLPLIEFKPIPQDEIY